MKTVINSDTNTENNFPKSDKPQEILKEEEMIHRFEPYNLLKYIWQGENSSYRISTNFQII